MALDVTKKIDILRFTTAGSVDDGKSTLIGRLLFDSKSIFEDQLQAIERTAKRKQKDEVDLALLTDGLAAEREQGITIDVAYRYFSTPQRKFIIADTPGHEQYTRNMVTGASTADLALILVDARFGVVDQTRRHLYIAHLLGIKHVFVCVNKMDLVAYEQKTFDAIVANIKALASDLKIPDLRYFPMSALHGDNIVTKGTNLSWFDGEPLLAQMEKVEVIADQDAQAFRFSVQYVNRPNLDFRGYAGQIASGVVHPGDAVTVLPSGLKSTVKQIVTYDGNLNEAFAPQSITLTLEDEIDISRGDVIVSGDDLPRIEKAFQAKICWMNESPLEVRKKYLLKTGTNLSRCMITDIDHRVDINNYNTIAADAIKMNDIAQVQIKSIQPIVCDGYQKNRRMGAFILIDELSNNTVAAGMIG